MGMITWNDKEYQCRSLNTDERRTWDNLVTEMAKHDWHPAEDYYRKLGDIPEAVKAVCVAEYLKTIDWNKPPMSVRTMCLRPTMVRHLLSMMVPDFPPEEVDAKTSSAILRLLNPYFIEISNG